MYQSLALFKTAAHMAQHAGTRQALTAQNIANADTPGYRAKHVPKFSEVATHDRALSMRASREGHLNSSGLRVSSAKSETMTEASPNGNAVSLEEEMMNAVSIAREHNRALTVYRHTMTVLRTTLGR